MKFYFEKDQTAIAEAEGEHEILANFLQSDIQQDEQLCTILLKKLNENNNYEMIGNSHEMTQQGETITIKNLLDDKSARYKQTFVLDTLKEWEHFISR